MSSSPYYFNDQEITVLTRPYYINAEGIRRYPALLLDYEATTGEDEEVPHVNRYGLQTLVEMVLLLPRGSRRSESINHGSTNVMSQPKRRKVDEDDVREKQPGGNQNISTLSASDCIDKPMFLLVNYSCYGLSYLPVLL